MRMATIRMLHHYVGLLIAPSVLFFALTGAYQLFSLHEAHGDYKPAPIIEKLGMMHKDQKFELKPHRAPPPAAVKPATPAQPKEEGKEKAPPVHIMALKFLFLAVALGLAGSTAFGVYIGVSHARRRAVSWALLAVGVIVPVVIAALPF